MSIAEQIAPAQGNGKPGRPLKRPHAVDLAEELQRSARDMDCAAKLLETLVPFSAVHYRIVAKRMREAAERVLRSI